jgi:CubicO group peptidase (beta-lactamase class C family)
MFRKRASAFVLLLILAASVSAQVNDVGGYIKAEMTRQRIPGLSLAVVKNGKTILAEGYGLANVELNVPARADTVFKIGSVSKQFLATGIMLLVQQGKVGLDDKVSKYLEGTPETWSAITVRHLLTHTSGLVREAPGFDPFKVQSDADVIKTAYPMPLRFQPGEKWEYCNVGYFILAEIIRKTSGKPWEDFLKDQVFSPLEMNATRTTTVAEIIPNRANAYSLRNDKLQNTDNWPALRPSGAFLSTVLDLAKWEAALYTNKILKQSDREQMWTQVTLNGGKKYPYGFGWDLDDLRGVSTVNHGGTLTGFRAQFTRFPDHGLTIIVLTNLASANVDGITRGVAGLFIPEIRLGALQAQPVPDPAMTTLFQALLSEYSNGNKELKQVTPELMADLSGAPQRNRDELSALLKNTKSFEFLARRDLNGKGFVKNGVPVTSLWFYRLTTNENKTFHYSFYLTEDKRVADLDVSAN